MSKIIGLDLGTKTIGFAISDALNIAAYPVKTLTFKRLDYNEAADIVNNLFSEYETNFVVIGNPLHLSGKASFMSNNVLTFINLLKEKAPQVKIELIDERFSTISATNSLHEVNMHGKKAKEIVDAISAAIILQTYLDKLKTKEKGDENLNE